jgi:hypothetical protein
VKGIRIVALLASLVVATAGLFAGAAQAGSGDVLTYNFEGCTGPAGTPSSFAAVRQEGAGGSFRLLDGSAIFVGLVFYDVTTGTGFSPPGLLSSGTVTVTCLAISPISGHTLVIGGFLAPPR